MRLHSFVRSDTAQSSTFQATATWEDADRPEQQIHFRVPRAHSGYLACDPQAFLVAALAPAMHVGERRLAMDEPACPELLDNLKTAMGILHAWFGDEMPVIPLEVEPRSSSPGFDRSLGAGTFLSGGVDSLALLRYNHLTFAPSHPRYIRSCFFVHGFDIGAFRNGDEELAAFDRALNALTPLAEQAGAALIPVYTTVRHLDDNVPSWMSYYHGASLSSVAHAMAGRLSYASIASSFAVVALRPWGSHPMLDPNYSSGQLQIRHDGLRFSRLDKVRLLADWPSALDSLRVCTSNPEGRLNCGQCEKCIRTMLELLAAGKLHESSAFPARDVTPDQLAGLTIRTAYQREWYQELIAPLEAMGRDDLADVLKLKLAELQNYTAWQEERDWKGVVKRFDRRFLNGAMLRLYGDTRQAMKHRSRPDSTR